MYELFPSYIMHKSLNQNLDLLALIFPGKCRIMAKLLLGVG